MQDEHSQADFQNRYRQLASAVVKSVAVVSARVGRWDYAVPVTDFLSVSYDPPTMLVSLYGLSRAAEALDGTDTFALSVLSEKQADLADRLDDPGGPLAGLLQYVDHFRPELPAEKGVRVDNGGGDAVVRIAGSEQAGAAPAPAVMRGALSWFVLRTVARHPAATHILYVAEVIAQGSDAPSNARPLLHWRGRGLGA